MKHLTINDIKISPPDFNSKIPKGEIISNWLINWIKYSLEYGIADIGDYIPTKEMLADYLNVSTTTIQNSIRHVKNLGYLTSKQSMGTIIADFYSKDIIQNELQQNTITESKIKKIILDDKIALNSFLPSIKELSLKTDISQNTIRLALIHFEVKGYVEKIKAKGNKYNWIYKKKFNLNQDEILYGVKDENYTLSHQLVKKIENYLEKTYKQGDKIHPNSTFANMFNVSIKTINDAMKTLNSKKIILSRRGKYGTIYLGNNQNHKNDFLTHERKKIDTSYKYIYQWQKVLSHLKKYINENYETGDKIASIRELAQILNVSPNTIRRALTDLFKNGNLVAKCGKNGGIFIMEMPEIEGDSYRWLALNPDAMNFN